MRKVIKKLAVLSSLGALIYQVSLPALANQETTKETLYQKAKRELPEDVYVIYRIVDRLARANGIDDHPWRIGVVQEYHINAFATQANLVALYDGLLDTVGGDTSAIACVVAHEMAHHTKRHLAIGPAEEAALRQKIQEEAETQVKVEIESAQSEAAGASVGGSLARTIGGIFGGWGSVGGNVAGAAADEAAKQRLASAEERVESIVAKKNG